ncbi:hypothetical protein, partial [Staphylococcus aureus]
NLLLTREARGAGVQVTNEATQLKGMTIEVATAQLTQAITGQLSRSEET